MANRLKLMNKLPRDYGVDDDHDGDDDD